MGSSAGRLRFALPLGAALVLLFISGSPAAEPTIDAAEGGNGYYWSPSHAEVGAGGSLAFRNTSPSVPHGVTWTGGPETPACSGVPIDDGKTDWSGTCSFAQAGTYAFRCYIHSTEMTGTITVTAGGSASPVSPSPPPPTAGPVASDLKLARNQRGRAVRGSIRLLRAGSGSRFEVDLTATRAHLLGTGHAGTARVGRLVHPSPPSGRFPFSISLDSAARSALRDREALPLTVTVTVTSPDGEVLRRTRGVVMLKGAPPAQEDRR
jgi:plastocyanin